MQETKNKKGSFLDDLKKVKDTFKGQNEEITTPQYLIDSTRYEFTPSYIKHNGRVMSIFKLYVRQGSNRQLTFTDVIGFIPVTTIPHVEIHVMSKDALMVGQEKQRNIKQNSKLSKNALMDSEEHEQKKNTNDKSMAEIRKSQMQDYDDYERILDSNEPLVAFKWLLVIIADTEEDVDDQIETINTLLDQYHEGARWDSLPGEQLQEFSGMFDSIKPNIYDHTSTGANYAGLSFSLSSGLMDEGGMPLGNDSLSLSGSTAFFDFDKYTRKQAFIAMPRSSIIPRYQRQNELQSPETPSLVAQAAANQIMMAGHRAHHIVLNDFNYLEKDRYIRPVETEDIFDKYDVLKVTINPLQGFGDIEDRVNIFARLKQKVANMFEILSDFSLNGNEKAEVLEAVNNFYFTHSLWSAGAEKYAHQSRIVNITDPTDYPTMAQLLAEFTNLSQTAEMRSRENRADRLDRLYSTLKENMSTYMGVLGRHTSIQSSNAPQVYYDFSDIESLQLKQVQLINMMDYIIYTANPGDVIVIHGFDSILKRVADMLLPTIQSAQKQGIRFIFTFDSIQSSETTQGKFNDIFQLQRTYYTDMDTDVDWSMIGKSLPNEIPLIEAAFNTRLGSTIEQMLQSKQPNQVLVHRKLGRINNFVRLNPIL